jgi:eukaryotic-like serine/threonine-protein kinase
MTECPTTDVLRAFLTGPLPSGDEAAVADHLERCPHCRSVLDNLSVAPDLPLGELPPTVTVSGDAPFLKQLQMLDSSALSEPSAPISPISSNRVPDVPGYEILGEIGRGGMGVVYRARHCVLGRPVAVKMLPPGLFPTEADRLRLRAEAETIARLGHENIVRLYEFGEADSCPYLILEYADRGTLRDWARGQPQPARLAAVVLEVLARAVHSAHEQRVVHRDLKPGNVLLCSPPSESEWASMKDIPFVPKVSDFGLARRLDVTDLYSRAMIGSPAYMAPEQVPDAQDPATPVGPSADVYALGVILYELLTGRPPFVGPDWMAVLFQVRRRDPLSPRQLVPGLPRDLETVCLKCLRKEAPQRYSSAADLAEDLRRFLDGRPIRARPLGIAVRTVRWACRHPALSATGLFALLAVTATLLTLAGLVVSLRRQQALEQRVLSQTESSLYFSHVTQAWLSWRDHDLGRARVTLDGCSPTLRRWEWFHLRSLCDDGIFSASAPAGHSVQAVALDGEVVAAVTSPDDSTPAVVSIWDLTSGIPRVQWTAPHGGKARAALLPGGLLITAGRDLTAAERTVFAVWSPGRTDTPVRTVTVGSVWALSENGTLVAEAGAGAQVWNLTDGMARDLDLGMVSGHVRVVALSANGTTIAAVTDTDELVVWRGSDPTPTHCWQLTTPGEKFEPPQSLAVSWNGKQVATCEGYSVRFRDIDTGKELRAQRAVSSRPGPMVYSQRGRYVVLDRPDGVRVFDKRINQRSTLAGPRGEHAASVTALALAPDPEDGMAVTGESNGAVRLWQLSLGQPRGRDGSVFRAHAGAVTAVAVTPGGNLVASGGKDGWIRAWDVARGQRAVVLPMAKNPLARGWTPDERFTLAVSEGQVTWYDAVTGRVAAVHPLPRNPVLGAVAVNGSRLMTAGPDGESIRVRVLPSAPKEWESAEIPLAGLDAVPDQVALSADGRFAAASGGEEGVVWRTDTGALEWRVRLPPGRVHALAIAPSGKGIAIVGEDQSVHLLTGDGSSPIECQKPEHDGFSHVVYHPDGRLVVAVGSSGQVSAWMTQNGEVVWSFRLSEPALGVGFSPDGSRVVAIGENGDTTILDTESGLEVLRLPVSDPTGKWVGQVIDPVFGPGGRRLLTPAPGGGALLRDAPPNLRTAREERLAGRRR